MNYHVDQHVVTVDDLKEGVTLYAVMTLGGVGGFKYTLSTVHLTGPAFEEVHPADSDYPEIRYSVAPCIEDVYRQDGSLAYTSTRRPRGMGDVGPHLLFLDDRNVQRPGRDKDDGQYNLHRVFLTKDHRQEYMTRLAEKRFTEAERRYLCQSVEDDAVSASNTE
jgi:hypothetical protein